jgi:universal stress protein A
MALTQHILVTTDFSPASDIGLEKAAELARATGARVTLAHVLDPSPLAPVALQTDAAVLEGPALKAQLQTALDELAERFFGGIEVTRKVLRSRSAADAIVAFAGREPEGDELPIDMIVLATHGRTGLAHLLIGSVAERVVRHAPCPVLTVRAEVSEGDA